MTMRKLGILLLCLVFVTLAACTVQPPVSSTALPTSTSIPPTAAITAGPVPSTTPTPSVTMDATAAITPSGPATCQVIPVVPTANPTAEVLMPSPSNIDWVNGSKTASITVTEYGDYQSTTSAQLYIMLNALQKKYPDDIRLVFRHFPLSEQYDKDYLAAQAAEAAGKQGKFWEFTGILYSNQNDWVNKSTDDFTVWANMQAVGLGLNPDQFKNDMLADATVTLIKNARAQAMLLIQAGTLTNDPFLFFNSVAVYPPYSLDILSSMVEYLKLPAKAFTSCPPMTVDPTKNYTATIHTEKGDIVIALYADKAPWAVNSFIYLAEQGWYNGSGFFRVIPGFLAQAGDPSNSGLGNPGYAFSDEFTPDLRFDKAGVVGMANNGQAGTNGSQFFFTYTAAPSLDGKYTVFGQVMTGMNF